MLGKMAERAEHSAFEWNVNLDFTGKKAKLLNWVFTSGQHFPKDRPGAAVAVRPQEAVCLPAVLVWVLFKADPGVKA